jgi:hypothetical protein
MLPPQVLGIGGNGFDLEHLHSALNAPDHRVLLVAAEVVLETLAQRGSDRR